MGTCRQCGSWSVAGHQLQCRLAAPVMMLFGCQTQLGTTNHVSDGGMDPRTGGALSRCPAQTYLAASILKVAHKGLQVGAVCVPCLLEQLQLRLISSGIDLLG